MNEKEHSGGELADGDVAAAANAQDQWVTVPCSAVLARLPQKLRGPAWQPDNFPAMYLMLSREDLAHQLAHGRVQYPAHLFLGIFPEGLISPAHPDVEITLDLAQVVAVLPPDLLQAVAMPHAAPAAVEEDPAHGHGVFVAKPAEPVQPAETAATAPEAAPAAELSAEELSAGAAAEEFEAAGDDRKAAAKGDESGWDGIERSMIATINGVDINGASAADLRRLPGIGASRAKEIIAHRNRHGKFRSIYALAEMPGIGEKLFRRATGLPLNVRRNRCESLNEMLGFEAGAAAPSLKVILERMATLSGASGCLLTGLDGIPMGCTAGVRNEAPRLAAVTTQLFRKTGKRLLSVLQDEVECLALPLGTPPRLLFAGENFFLIVVEGNRRLNYREVRRAGLIFKEIRWMLSRRAVVSEIGLM